MQMDVKKLATELISGDICEGAVTLKPYEVKILKYEKSPQH